MLREIHGETKTAFYVRGLRRLLNLRSLVVKKKRFFGFFLCHIGMARPYQRTYGASN